MAYKFKLHLTSAQEAIFSSWAGSCRFLYNLCLEHRIVSWTQYRQSVNYYDQANELKVLKKCIGFEWLKLSPAQILQQSLKDLDKAFKSFWASGFGFPKYKRKGEGDSFRFPDPTQFEIEKVNNKRGVVKLPKIGKIVFRMSREIIGKVKNATIKRESSGWYISFCVEKEIEIPANQMGSLGIDRGIAETLVLSSEKKDIEDIQLSLPERCKVIRRRIELLQRRLSKKKKHSGKWKKILKQIRKLHTLIARIRYDFLHKASSYIAKNHGHVSLEDLRVKNMSSSAKGTQEKPGKNVKAKSGLNREILFQGWGTFALLLKYKCEWNGGYLSLVDPKYTSTRCSKCFYNDRRNRKKKTFKCLNCGYTDDADKNASININRVGLTRSARGDVCISKICEMGTSSCALAR